MLSGAVPCCCVGRYKSDKYGRKYNRYSKSDKYDTYDKSDKYSSYKVRSHLVNVLASW
jgi:hypothetical protein